MVLTIYNPKGGATKTSTGVNLSDQLADDYNVLFVDLDQSVNGASYFDQKASTPYKVSDFLFGQQSIDACAFQVRAGLWSLVGDTHLSESNAQWNGIYVKEEVLAEALAAIPGGRFDIIVVDGPGHWNLLSKNALMAATHHLIPACDADSVSGIVDIDSNTSKMYKALKHQPPERGIFLNKYNAKKRISRAVEKDCKTEWPDEVLQTRIRERTFFGDMSQYKQVLSQVPHFDGHDDFAALIQELKTKKWL